MGSITYFEELDRWRNRYSRVTDKVAKRMLNEHDCIVGDTKFSQLEICRILNNK